MGFKFSVIDKNNLYHNILLNIKEKNTNEAAQSILFLFENFIDQNLNQSLSSEDDEENEEIKPDTFKPGGTFRRVPS